MHSQSDTNLDYSDDANTKPLLQRVRMWYRGLPDKKRYLEFVTALLTIPVLLTVLLSNVSNLQNQKNSAPSPTPASATPTTTPLPTDKATPSATLTPAVQCTPGIGPIEIAYPVEGTTVDNNPICLDIPRQNANYCAVVWSYRINGSPWSEYTDREICMYGIPPGDKQLELRIKSIVSGEEKILKRSFTVAGSVTPTPATQSGIINTL